MIKKIVIFSLFLFCCQSLNAAERFDLVRSTDINGAFQTTIIATGTIRFIDIQVASAAVGSTFVFNNSTATNMITSTSTVFDTGSMVKFDINQTLDNGFMFTTTGNSKIMLRWDYIGFVPVGKSALGYR